MTELAHGHGIPHAYETEESHERTAGKGKPRHDAPDLARRTDEPSAGQSGPVAPDSGRGQDGGGAREALRPLVEHPKVDSDLRKLPKGIQQAYHERVDDLRRGVPHPSTHTLGGPFKGSGWQATRLNFQYRMVHKHIGDELHVLSAGNHDETYDMGQRRLGKTASIRQVPPEELGNFHFPDYPKARTPAALVKHFKKTSPEYFEKVKDDVAKNGFSTPALARFNDPRGRPLKKPVFMEGHHRAAVAHELGIHLPVGDYDSHEDYDVAFKNGQQWFRENQRPVNDMPKQGARWMPKERLFGRTYGLDHRLFDEQHNLRPDVRKYILETLNSFWQPTYGINWDQWARVYFAGSEASEWTSETLEGNNDFDILIGVDYDAFRRNGSRKFDAHKTDLQITDQLNEGLRNGLNPRTANAMIMVDGQLTGPWDNTWYVNPHSYDIRDIRPYAAYDVTNNRWAVKPPHLPEWSTKAFPEGKGLEREIRGILDMAKGILAMPEPYRTQNGRALWEFVHSNRSDAFGPQGEGWYDPRNVIEKALDQAGLMQQLWALMDNSRRDPRLLDAPAGWSNDPRR
jgi:hypothetical protein